MDLGVKLLKQMMLVNPKRKLWDLESDLQGKDRKHTINSWSVVWQYQDYHNLVLGQYQDYIFLLYRTDPQVEVQIRILLNSLTPKSIPAGTKLALFGRYVLNIYVGIVRYFLRTTKTQRAKIYLPTQRTNRRISYNIN